ncbi:site-specific integrase [Methylobrevis pamukkalensis]|uniref:Tyrosine recombinase XerC n=1 Tax=Methylobrevis pamukkalensis TaxID=1439726 RepID=A0A1E3H0S0_9HYPH|nr:site-specific integrase [Methylobrevis pamukkalensis]ODN69900.1 Tyrosine recombinase XerC [Methylobrevis pamukkalensis]
MGTIIERPRKKGPPAYLAQISLMRDGRIVHRESRTFDRRPAAAAWMRKREKELAAPGGIEAAQRDKRNPTLGDAIDRYLAETGNRIGRTKTQVLKSLKAEDIAGRPCEEIRSPDIVDLARALGTRMQPQTVGNYLSHLGAIFAIARPAWGYPLDKGAMDDARIVMRKLGMTSKSLKRERRPALDELDRLMTHFADRSARAPTAAPMHALVAFALFSTRRQEEITRLAWADLDEAGSRILVRDMKHPGQKRGNDLWCDLPTEALAIIRSQPREGDLIYPYSTDAISAAFTRACKVAGIEDLHFHDLRHEGVSRLFEMGLSIPRVAAVSGHRSWSSLQRYTHLRQTGDKWAGWHWLTRIAPHRPEAD